MESGHDLWPAMPNPSDPRAVLRIVRILTRHQLFIQGYALAITADHQLAEDVYQEVACVVSERLEVLPRDEEIVPWLREVTRRKALELLRRKRRVGLLLSDETLDLLDQSFEVQEDSHELRTVLERCIAQLADGHRRILEGRYRENLSAQEIGERVSRSVEAVYSILKRVRRALARCIRANIGEGGNVPEVIS
jgi:RNA polymerase sigma-70 factor (ECF subfamily)